MLVNKDKDKVTRAGLPHDSMTARRRVDEHIEAERTNDVANIMSTMSAWDQHYSFLSATPEGPLRLFLAENTAEVHEHYVDRVRSWSLAAGHGLKKIQSPWYTFHEAVGEFRTFPSGEVVKHRLVFLFPTWTDGIIGEISWEPQWSEEVPSDWRQEADVARCLDELDATWASGDVDTRLALVEDDCCSVIRTVELGGNRRLRTVARNKAELRAAWSVAAAGQVVSMERTNRVIAHFYAFEAYRMLIDLPHGRVEREVARLYPVGQSGRFIGELSYSFDVPLSGATS